MKTLYIIRGLPGSGKSTLAKKLRCEHHAEADHFFIGADGGYRFDARDIKDAHAQCQDTVRHAMKTGEDISVANTFTQRWEIAPYIKMADERGYQVHEIVCRGNWQNVHGVPNDKIEQMRARWED